MGKKKFEKDLNFENFTVKQLYKIAKHFFAI